ncbi:MAG: hypothetical protein AAF828_00050 [Bacteroidota bacterium]
MKTVLKSIGGLLLVLFLFRGPIFRQLFSYVDVGSRPTQSLSDLEFIQAIRERSSTLDNDLVSISALANLITAETLKFTTGKASANPDELVKTGQANCVGYAALFAAIAEVLIREKGLENQVEIQHKIGKLYLLDFDLHSLFKSPFFRDHGYVELQDRSAKTITAVDPSVSDYLWIKRVNKE